jgi:hypothetical protein
MLAGVIATPIRFAAGSDAPAPAASTSTAVSLDGLASISVYPQQVTLHGSRGRQQLVVTGLDAAGQPRDLTSVAAITSSNNGVAAIDGSVVTAVADGTSALLIQAGPHSAAIPVTVQKAGEPAPVSFQNETIAALTKAGCNMGACHGSPSGKGGFRLSLRGYDAPFDLVTLRSEFHGRRVNAINPDESLILRKPLMELAHGGGRRLKKSDGSYHVLRNWIAEGLRPDPDNTPTLTSISVFPEARVFQQEGRRQQLVVMGTFSDGSLRDVTPLVVFSSSNENVGRVSEHGTVDKMSRGETVILARYLDKMATSAITFLEPVPGFVWSNPPEHNFIDSAVNAKLIQLQILPSDLCTDEEFVRRAYLDATGRLPTVEEARAFLSTSDPDKRNSLIDMLVDSDDFASYQSLLLGDVLRANTKRLTSVGVHKFRLWLYEAIRNDMPYDQLTRELLTASGSAFTNPAAAYWRASRDPEDATETTAQLFMGIRMQCAKCHNHPFERWTQDNYYGVGAAFARIGRKPGLTADDEVVFSAKGGEVVQPRTGKAMPIHLLLTGEVQVPQDQDRREVFAAWLTEPTNPFFARAGVNRIWGQLMGRGIVEPVDDFRDSNPPSNGPLLDQLADEFARNGFSRKWAVKTIMKSRTYQLSAQKNALNANDELYNSHAATRMLGAEQLLDAICAVTGVPEQFPGMPLGARATELPEPPTEHYFLKVFGQPQREMACQCERGTESNLSQALQMINGPVVHNKLRDDAGRIARLIAAGKTDDEIVEELYLAALSRPPQPDEVEASRQHIAASSDRRLALEDIGWAILNGKEFLFQH